MKFHWKKPYTYTALAAVLVIGLVAVAVYGVKEYEQLAAAHSSTLETLVATKEENLGLLQYVRDQEYQIENFQEDLESLGSTLGTLEKLSKTDEELLKKYSKVYFLNENYTPAKLSLIDEAFVYPAGGEEYIQGEVRSYLEDMLESAQEDGVELRVASAYRSFDEQRALKSGYKVLYGYGANQFSADQGYSEHQLGTTVDLTTPKLGGMFSAIETDPAYKWLQDNAYKYGFVLSYPKGNVFYRFEPWHWRFVGRDLAEDLHDDEKYFYDLDQREIDEYLVKLFD
jgi:LAS superfamily LD-carboxypeptidase LdcB